MLQILPPPVAIADKREDAKNSVAVTANLALAHSSKNMGMLEQLLLQLRMQMG